jgi:hypothetical protein
MGAYRVHAGGVWSLSSLVRRCRANIAVAERMNALLGGAFDAELTRAQLGFELTIERHAGTPEERREAGAEVDRLLARLRAVGGPRWSPRMAAEVRLGRAGLMGFRAADRAGQVAARLLQRPDRRPPVSPAPC